MLMQIPDNVICSNIFRSIPVKNLQMNSFWVDTPFM